VLRGSMSTAKKEFEQTDRRMEQGIPLEAKVVNESEADRGPDRGRVRPLDMSTPKGKQQRCGNRGLGAPQA